MQAGHLVSYFDCADMGYLLTVAQVSRREKVAVMARSWCVSRGRPDISNAHLLRSIFTSDFPSLRSWYRWSHLSSFYVTGYGRPT